jgi:hypothetical protein
MRTLPLGSNVAAWLTLGAARDPVGVNVSVAGSYSSALAAIFVADWYWALLS